MTATVTVPLAVARLINRYLPSNPNKIRTLGTLGTRQAMREALETFQSALRAAERDAALGAGKTPENR
jgi:hypothetical protein